jgi:uncharacterized membrane protein YfcA
MTAAQLFLAALAAFAAGVTNALVGGGTLITFPALLALGIPPVAASATNTVALSPGYLAGAYAQRSYLRQRDRSLVRLLIVATIGGLVGGLLLLATSNKVLSVIVPILLAMATMLLALQPRLKQRLSARRHGKDLPAVPEWLPFAVGAVAVYGGFFGAGLGVMLLAVLGIALEGSMTEANALKQLLSLVINVAAAILFVFSGHIWWAAAAAMSIGAMLGGTVGGRLANRIDSERFRIFVVIVGATLSVVYAVKYWF